MKFLIALDKSNNSLRVVKFVAVAINPSCEVTLMSILPKSAAACGLDAPSEVHPLLKENVKNLCLDEEALSSAVEGFLDEAKNHLVKCGFLPDKISIVLRKERTDTAGDLLTEAKEGSYDAIVIGRRGISALKQFMFGSVSNKVVTHADKAVIVVD